MKTAKILLLIGLTVYFLGCNDNPDFPVDPVIEYVGVNKFNFSQRFEGLDSLIIFLSFTDGDGDIGSNENTGDVELIDTRRGDPLETLSLPMVPEQGSGNGISGDIQLLTIFRAQLDICCIPPNGRVCESFDSFPQDTFSVLVRIRDRAGNWSNQIETDPIFIECN